MSQLVPFTPGCEVEANTDLKSIARQYNSVPDRFARGREIEAIAKPIASNFTNELSATGLNYTETWLCVYHALRIACDTMQEILDARKISELQKAA